MPRAVVVVEDRYSSVFKLNHVRPAVVAGMLAECQVHIPQVPVIFEENRALIQEWHQSIGYPRSESRKPAKDARIVGA